MNRQLKLRARRLVICGFAFSLLGALLAMYRLTSPTFSMNPSFELLLDYFLAPFVSMATLWSWWWITRLDVNDVRQCRIVRMAYYGFFTQTLATGILFTTTIVELPVSIQGFVNLDSYYADAAGAFLSSAGFFFLARLATVPQESENTLTSED